MGFVSREEEEGFLERKLDDITTGVVGWCGEIQVYIVTTEYAGG